jgi:hypothetical protein
MQESKGPTDQNRAPLFWMLGIGGGLVSLASLAAIISMSITHKKMRSATQAGRATSALMPQNTSPLTTVLRNGTPGDPLNLQIQATDRQIGAALALASWYRADEIDLVTSIRISADSVFGRAYSTAPVSNLFLFGRKEDLAFERPGTSVRQRDHLRLWQTSEQGTDGRPIWVGSATRDIKVELSHTDHLPTHGISPDIDSERALVVSELAQTGYVVSQTTRPGFGQETQGKNGGGDPYFTDGQVAVLTLANVWTPTLTVGVRGPLLGRLASKFVGLIRPTLPKAGRQRAASEQANPTAPGTDMHSA